MEREEVKVKLIRQFPVEVVETEGSMSRIYYSCPTCGRSVSKGMDKCTGCEQVLSWKNIGRKEKQDGSRKAVLEFDVPEEFVAGDARSPICTKRGWTTYTNARCGCAGRAGCA